MIYWLLGIWNVAVFALYGIDKRKAMKGAWRIKEPTLLLMAFLMGGIGAWLGMQVFRHKTHHMKFKILVPFATFVNIAVYIGGLYIATRHLSAF